MKYHNLLTICLKLKPIKGIANAVMIKTSYLVSQKQTSQKRALGLFQTSNLAPNELNTN